MCVLFQSKEIKAPVKIGRFGLAIQCSDGQTIQVMKIFCPQENDRDFNTTYFLGRRGHYPTFHGSRDVCGRALWKTGRYVELRCYASFIVIRNVTLRWLWPKTLSEYTERFVFMLTLLQRTTVIKSLIIGKVAMTSSSWTGISESAKNLVTRMLTLDPRERLTVTEVHCPLILFAIQFAISTIIIQYFCN